MMDIRSSVSHPKPAHGQAAPLGGEPSAVRRACEDEQTVVVFSLSADAIEFLAARFSIDSARVAEMLKSLGVAEVSYMDCCWGDLARAEARELLKRMRMGLPLPQLIHACPKWANTVEKEALIPYFSKAKSNAQQQGLCLRQQISARRGISLERTVHVTVVGCPARKEALVSGGFDLPICGGAEHVLTAREVALWLLQENVKPAKILARTRDPGVRPSSRLQDVLAHAVLLTTGCAPAADFLTLAPSCAYAGVMEGKLILEGRTLRVATVRGADNALALLSRVRAGREAYELAEVLSCASRCTGG